MREQEMRVRIARVIDDIDAGRVRPTRGTGRYLGSTVLVATMSLSGCANEPSVEPAPTTDTATASADPLPEPVAEYAVVDPAPVPEYAAIMPSADPTATTSASAEAAPSATAPPKTTAKPDPTTTREIAPANTRTIRHPPPPYMAPDP